MENEASNEDLSFCFYSACSMLGACNLEIDAVFVPFRSLKVSVERRPFSNKLVCRVSDGFQIASQDVLMGLALWLVARVLRKRKVDNYYTREYQKFMKRKSTFELNNSIRAKRAIRRKNRGVGAEWNLSLVLAKVVGEYGFASDVKLPSVAWSRNKSRRRLAFFDEALNQIVVSRLFDSPRVPLFVVEYLVFHELLHAKHTPFYERGKSLQCRVHHRVFKKEEQSFKYYGEAENWIDKQLRFVR